MQSVAANGTTGSLVRISFAVAPLEPAEASPAEPRLAEAKASSDLCATAKNSRFIIDRGTPVRLQLNPILFSVTPMDYCIEGFQVSSLEISGRCEVSDLESQ